MSLNSNEVVSFLSKAVNAPSGHNCQPWKFAVKNNVIEVWNIPNKDKTLFNHNQKGSYIAHGALIENIKILTSHSGYKSRINLLPNSSEPNLIAQIELNKSESPEADLTLHRSIMSRATNRRPYDVVDLRNSDWADLKEFIIDEKQNCEIVLLRDRTQIKRAAKILSVGDRVLFDNKHLHNSLFEVVNWTKAQEEERKEGLYIETKELPPPAEFLFRHVISHRWLMDALYFMKLPEKIGQKREALYSSSSAIGMILTKDQSPEAFINAGRLLQRFWLKITDLGMSLQPASSGLLFLAQRLESESAPELTVHQREYVSKAYDEIKEVFCTGDKIPAFTFRVGYAKAPSAVSLKKAPEITFM